ncbi:MAG TPA: SDR family NAD(P)-dependent oxidoreductase [Terriglobales bacterium]|nr:SDR family NAD(P)-dependent oxidoreductase [Terriglobales bacterium]
MAEGELRGKAALVTGGARRIGREIALALAAAGADVAITYLESAREARQTAEDIRRLGVRALALACDVRQEKSVRNAVKTVAREFGGLDVLVNNAAIYETVAFEKITLRRWDEMFAVNARGPFLMSQAALKPLRQRQGRIIHLGSLGGLRPWATHAHYCASKAALTMLTEVMAKALAPELAVNCVAPGMIDLGDGRDAALLRRVGNKTPMQRNGKADEVVRAVLFFATAPRFITGQVLAVDGGLGLE